MKNDCADYDPYMNYDPDYGYKCGDCHPVNIARDWVINGYGVAKDSFLFSFTLEFKNLCVGVFDFSLWGTNLRDRFGVKSKFSLKSTSKSHFGVKHQNTIKIFTP